MNAGGVDVVDDDEVWKSEGASIRSIEERLTSVIFNPLVSNNTTCQSYLLIIIIGFLIPNLIHVNFTFAIIIII